MPLSIPLNIKLHATQQFIHERARIFTIVKSGKRMGKSVLAIYRLLQKAGMSPNGCCWYISPFFSMSKKIAWHEMLKMLPAQMIRKKLETELYLELFNGCRIQLLGADNPDSLRGPKLSHVCFDEAAFIREEVWPLIRGQLLGNERSGTADFISSPNPKGRNWFSAFFDDALRKMNAGDPNWAAFYRTIWDNPTIPIQDIKDLERDTADQTWQLEYLALEGDFSGEKFAEFSYDKHVSTYVAPPDGLPMYRAIDWGLTHPTVCLWARVDKANNLIYITQEFSRSGLVIREVAEVIKDMNGPTVPAWTVIDPSAARRDQVTGKSLKDEFLRCGIGCVDGDRRGADNIAGRGIDIVKGMLKRNMIRVHPSCKNLIYELRTVQWGQKEGDDSTDAFRYLLVRLHDLVFNGVLNSPQELSKAEPNRFNLNDKILFPGREAQYSNDIVAQLNAY